MTDLLGLGFIVLLVTAGVVGLKVLSRPQTRTAEEFERNAAEGTTMLGAGMNALQELLDPQAAKAKEIVTQMKEGRYQTKKREGKASGTTNEDNHQQTTDDQQNI